MSERRRHRKQKQKSYGKMIATVIAFLAVFFVGRLFFTNDELIGRWAIDEVTVYEFEKGGKGALVLPSGQYEFKYTAKEDVIEIDFVSESATDSSYSYKIEGSTMTWERIGGYAGSYTMTKQK